MATKKTKSTTSEKTTRPKVSATTKTTKEAKVTKTPKKASSTAAKKTVVKETAPIQDTPRVTETPKRQLPKLRIQRRYLILGVIAIALIGLAVYFRELFVVAMVNGQPITRLNYIQETEGVYIPDARVTAGKQALNQIVTKKLINQEAQKKNVSVSEKEIDDEIGKVRKNLEGSGQDLESALALQGDTLEAYKERIRIQKLLEKLVGQITVTDKEVNDYIAQNQQSLPQDMGEAELKKQVTESLKQQKFNEKVQTLIQDLQQKAKVTYFIQQ